MNTYFQYFSCPINEIELPRKFTFPFYYEPHPLSKLAVKEIINYLKTQTDFEHNFGLGNNYKEKISSISTGKMFGVLVVKNKKNEIGYISSVSGKLANTNTHIKFVPPVHDMLAKNSYYLKEKKKLLKISSKLENLKNNIEYQELVAQNKLDYNMAKVDILEKEKVLKINKQNRNIRRKKASNELPSEKYTLFEEKLSKESLADKYFLKNVKRYWEHTLKPIRERILVFENQIRTLKEERKLKSIELQLYTLNQYEFLNEKKHKKKLAEIFSNLKTPLDKLPAGSGECAAPKLLQYAFLHDLKPITMAEFWWGKSPNKEIRKHKHFYPACQGKCKPILTHMLSETEMDINPLLKNNAIGKKLEIIFEDNELIVVNKPTDFLSVPGIHIQDSVYTRIKQQFKNISGPIIVHRLDMATSGLLVLAKNKEAHKYLQAQFINKTIHKRYTALLDGIITENEGTIMLPLRVDLDDRPRQLVCYEHGKPAKTNWKVIERKDNKTKIHFYPISGRTHQLRVHASHNLGLNTPIIGDDLYGKKADRLYLHSDTLTFLHPKTNKKMVFTKKSDF